MLGGAWAGHKQSREQVLSGWVRAGVCQGTEVRKNVDSLSSLRPSTLHPPENHVSVLVLHSRLVGRHFPHTLTPASTLHYSQKAPPLPTSLGTLRPRDYLQRTSYVLDEGVVATGRNGSPGWGQGKCREMDIGLGNRHGANSGKQ